MINGVSIPIMTPFKFYPATSGTGNGVNFQNVDNTKLSDQSWGGVYPNCFAQPVPRYWHDYSYGIDFQVYLNENILSELKADIIDTDGNTVQELTRQNFFEWVSDFYQIRFYADRILGVPDGYYRIKLYEDGGDDIYYSELIEIKDTFEQCYPIEFSNFENDFGLIFEDSVNGLWSCKMLIPMRMFKPVPSDERESYRDDNQILTTLRSTPKRVYELESLPVPTWYAEKIKMLFSCSDITLNKMEVNAEETPDIEIISESDLMTITGEIQINAESTDYVPTEYLQQDQLNTVTELLTEWNESTGGNADWTLVDFDGKEIQTALFEDSGIGILTTNSFSITTGNYYLLDFSFTVVDGLELYINSIKQFDVVEGHNVFIFKAPTTGSVTLQLKTLEDTPEDFSATCSMKKIN